MLSLWTACQSRVVGNERGLSVTGYALLAALLAVVAMTAAVLLGDAVDQHLNGSGP